MKRVSLIKYLSIFSVSLFLHSTANAGGVSPFYIGGTIGGNLNDSQELTKKFCNKPNYNCKKMSQFKMPAATINGGFHFSESLAVEGGYAYLGRTAELDASAVNAAGNTLKATYTQDTQSVFAAGVVRMGLRDATPVRL